MTEVVLDQLTKTYAGAERPAVDHLSLEIESGEIVALLGPSGCGKTTTLKMIAGLLHPTGGDILFDGESVLPLPAEKRGAVMVFQNHVLFPYLNVEQNVGFGLKMRGLDGKVIEKKVGEMLELVQMPDVGRRRPNQLSGGQQQRIALARALITQPRLMLLDEPLGNLDAHLRDEMRELILSVQHQFDITTLVVTHDQGEAVLLADRIALIFDGVLQQYALPADFYRRPATERVARFFGGMNFIPAEWQDGKAQTALGAFDLDLPADVQLNEGPALLTIRPEHIRLGRKDGPNTCVGLLRECIYVGTHTRCKIKLGNHEIEATSAADSGINLRQGEEIRVHFPSDRIWLLSVRDDQRDSRGP